MEDCVNGSVTVTDIDVSSTQPSNPQSLFRKPDIYCRFSACLHTLGAISIVIGCLLVGTYNVVGILFLSIGFCLTIAGLVFVLTAVSLVMKRSRNRKYRDINRKFCDNYRTTHQTRDLKLELVSNYMTPTDKNSSSTLTSNALNKSYDSLDLTLIDPIIKNTSESKVELINRQLVKPELTIEPPQEEDRRSRTPTPSKKRPPLSPSKCSATNRSDTIIPFYPPRSPSNEDQRSMRCSPNSVSRSVSKCSLNSGSTDQRSRSVSPQRHQTFIY